jgi:hypothetical protein
MTEWWEQVRSRPIFRKRDYCLTSDTTFVSTVFSDGYVEIHEVSGDQRYQDLSKATG